MVIEKKKAEHTTALLEELLKSHGLESELYEDWAIPKGSDYGLKGYWYPEATENTGQLSIELFLNSERIIVESFAGQGENNKERLKQAFASFVHHAFSTFLMAIWGKSSDAVQKEIWEVKGKKFEVYLGEKGIINYDKSKALTLPENYASRLKALVVEEPLDKEFHWFTFFYANLNGLDNYSEILKDNMKLISSAESLKKLNWQRSNHYYALRQFVILKSMDS